MAKKYKVISPRLNKVMFFVQSLFFGGVGMLFLVSLIYFMIDDPPPAETLVYENCKFVKYEFEQKKGARGSVYNHYYIYVEEYEEPLEIDEMVFQSIKVHFHLIILLSFLPQHKVQLFDICDVCFWKQCIKLCNLLSCFV